MVSKVAMVNVNCIVDCCWKMVSGSGEGVGRVCGPLMCGGTMGMKVATQGVVVRAVGIGMWLR